MFILLKRDREGNRICLCKPKRHNEILLHEQVQETESGLQPQAKDTGSKFKSKILIFRFGNVFGLSLSYARIHRFHASASFNISANSAWVSAVSNPDSQVTGRFDKF